MMIYNQIVINSKQENYITLLFKLLQKTWEKLTLRLKIWKYHSKIWLSSLK